MPRKTRARAVPPPPDDPAWPPEVIRFLAETRARVAQQAADLAAIRAWRAAHAAELAALLARRPHAPVPDGWADHLEDLP